MQPLDEDRHFGLVVDDRQAVRDALIAHDVWILPSPGLDFRDPSDNRIQIVQYDEIQFTKTDAAPSAPWASPTGRRRRRPRSSCAGRGSRTSGRQAEFHA